MSAVEQETCEHRKGKMTGMCLECKSSKGTMPEQDARERAYEQVIRIAGESDMPPDRAIALAIDAGWNARSEENAELKEKWDGSIDQRADYFSRLCRLAEAKGEFDHMGDTGDTAKWHRLEHLLESGIYYERMVSRTSE